MGGCRCSYRNCHQRSDGKTHMFHYPVFDKVRCHQWLKNAQKLEFLNLKVSQLKNRVVCQHHFRDDNFMNFKNDKLTFEAVPTENGPYCDSGPLEVIKPEKDNEDYNISLDDIENDFLTLHDKKEKFSVKYGDFLTNCDLMDLTAMNENDKQEKTPDKPTYIINNHFFKPNFLAIQYGDININPENETAQNKNTVVDFKKHDYVKQKTITNNRKSLTKDSKVTILAHKKITNPAKIPLPSFIELQPVSPSRPLPLPTPKRNTRSNIAKENHIMIEILPIDNKLGDTEAPQLPKAPIELTDITSSGEILIRTEPTNNNTEVSNNITVNNVNEDKLQQGRDLLQGKPLTANIQSNKTQTTNRSIIKKSCLSPEKMAAIQEKRKFNMKLRDIIETCLDNMDEQEKGDGTTKTKKNLEKNCIDKSEAPTSKEHAICIDKNEAPTSNEHANCIDKSEAPTRIEHANVPHKPILRKKPKSSKKIENEKEQTASYPTKGINTPLMEEYAISYLEARIKKMEETLIEKIDLNSQRITDLKTTLGSDKTTIYPTVLNEEVRKKQLYNEISKFLTPTTNSLIYEELFINKFVRTVKPNSPKVKRRKYR